MTNQGSAETGRDNRLATTARGHAVLTDPRLNRGTAFTLAERQALGLIGLLPQAVVTQEQQAARVYEQFRSEQTALEKYVSLSSLRDRNEVLFYRLVTEHLAEILPIVYTPTVGTAIEHYNAEYRRPHGVYLSVDDPQDIERALSAAGLGPDDVDLIVATDGEAILGIGDWGVGGVDIAVGKLVVYTAAGGVDPRRVLPVMLDVGTNRQTLLDDPGYLGNRHPRADPETYDAFIDAYVQTAGRLFPHALLHWEDFGTANAHRILDRYRDSVFTFNDDIQGTGAVTLAAVLAGVAASGRPLREHRIVIFGAGSAGIGIADDLREALHADGLSPEQATAQIWCVDRYGLLTDDQDTLRDFQVRYARPAAESADWAHEADKDGVTLAELVDRIHPTILIGTSGRGGAFTEPIVRAMAAHTDRPLILPMSNPTDLAEATPADLLTWTEGRALIAAGSPFDPVEHNGTTYQIAQANNALVFPGLGLGAIVARATRVTDAMLAAAASAVAARVDTDTPGAPILPPVPQLRETSVAVAVAVARAAAEGGVAGIEVGDQIEAQVRAAMWQPVYPEITAI